ncbi:MAG: hypothetical protein ACXW0F_11425 [Gaiellaceae bacterium]
MPIVPAGLGAVSGGRATWPEFAEGLYGFLTGRGATIEYDLDQLEIMVPRNAADTSPQAKWKLNGTIRIRTSERGK